MIGLGRQVQGKFASYPEWEDFDWGSRFSSSTAGFDVKVHILVSGFTLQRPFPR